MEDLLFLWSNDHARRALKELNDIWWYFYNGNTKIKVNILSFQNKQHGVYESEYREIMKENIPMSPYDCLELDDSLFLNQIEVITFQSLIGTY